MKDESIKIMQHCFNLECPLGRWGYGILRAKLRSHFTRLKKVRAHAYRTHVLKVISHAHRTRVNVRNCAATHSLGIYEGFFRNSSQFAGPQENKYFLESFNV